MNVRGRPLSSATPSTLTLALLGHDGRPYGLCANTTHHVHTPQYRRGAFHMLPHPQFGTNPAHVVCIFSVGEGLAPPASPILCGQRAPCTHPYFVILRSATKRDEGSPKTQAAFWAVCMHQTFLKNVTCAQKGFVRTYPARDPARLTPCTASQFDFASLRSG